MDDSSAFDTTLQNRRMGRPRNADRPVIPWEEVDRLLVFGETVRDEETGHETVRYPSHRELGRRYGVSGSLIGRYSSQHQCMERREENIARERISFDQKVIEKLAEARAISTAEAIAIVDDYIRRFRDALDEGRVRADGASDFNTMMRLKAFLEGKADSRQEVQGMITLEDMQARHRALRAQLESLDPAITCEVQPRDRDRTRGLLAEQADSDGSPDGAMVSRRASEKSRARGLPTEQPDAHVDVERAPRRRVVAHERADALLDDVSFAEREDWPRGDERATRRRTLEYVDIDHDAEREETREPRRARAATPAHVRALKRRTREEIEEDRVPQRAQAAKPARTTARRPRRPGREERVELPDVVYSRSPGRGWEDEPEEAEPGLRRPWKDWR